MKSQTPCFNPRAPLIQYVSLLLAIALLVAPICAQRPAAKAPAPQAPDPTFDNLLGADAYKMYGEVRNIGQLMSNGGLGEIVDPIIKLADPPQEFKSIIKFLKTNSESLATARLLFATWPARTDVPDAFVAIEFGTREEASKFAPKLEAFLPTVLPPAPEPTPESSPTPAGPAQAKQSPKEPVAVSTPSPAASPKTAAERLPFVISRRGNLVLISDKAFKFERLHPAGTKSLFEDQNFRIAHDLFSTEPVFVFINVTLEEKKKPVDKQQQAIVEAETERMKPAEADTDNSPEETATPMTAPTPNEENQNEPQMAVLMAGPDPSPQPTPTKEQQAQAIASSQVGHMLDALGYGEPQWPEAVGLALTLDNSDYVIKSILIDSPDARKLPLPFVPQLISGPSYVSDAPSVLPDDTEVFVTTSIDFLQTYEAMRKAAEVKAKAEVREIPAGEKEPPLDSYAEFEKRAGIKIKDDLIPAFGNEIAVAGSLKTLQGATGLVVGGQTTTGRTSTDATASKDGKDDKEKKGSDVFPMLLLAVKDREAARRVLPHILDGLGFGEANLIASVEKREDTELVNYAGVFAYAFVGNFVVVSDAPTVRHVIDGVINHQTLSSNSAFRNSRRWEPTRTLGQIYVSPALMEEYHEEIRKSSLTGVDPAMRDFLLGLDPTASAITYALSNDGLGTQHEIHVPRNLILTMVAGISSATKNPPPEMNEAVAIGLMQMINGVEGTYQSTAGKGKYGTLDELMAQNLLSKDMFDKYGYNFEISASGDHYEAVATPKEYGKTGKRSFFVDKTGVVRGDDHGGAPATSADKPAQ